MKINFEDSLSVFLFIFVITLTLLSYFPEEKHTDDKVFENTGYIINCQDGFFNIIYNGRNILGTFEKIPCDKIEIEIKDIGD